MYIGAGLPPVPPKLVKRIQDGQFIDMAELLPTNLSSSQPTDDEQPNKTKNKYQEVTNIVRWLQCFGIYLAVISQSAPHRTLDLLGYQNLIIQGYLNYQDGRWVVYDRQFRQKASATLVPEWSAIDTTLWNLAFSSHVTGHHDDKPQEATYLRKDPPQAYRTPWKSSPLPRKQRICLEWNDTPSTNCPYPACRYEHTCYRCAHNPSITDRHHKAMFCPQWVKQAPPTPLFPSQQ